MRKSAIVFVLFLIFPAVLPSTGISAPQEVIQSLTQKLEAWDVAEAWTGVKGLLANEPKDPQLLELASHIAFHQGDYQEALMLIKQAIEQGKENESRKTFSSFIEETLGVVSSLKKYESPHFMISLDEKQDGILIDYLIDALEKTYQTMAQQYG